MKTGTTTNNSTTKQDTRREVRAFDDLLNHTPPVTPQLEDRTARIARIRAEIQQGRYLTEDRIRGTIGAIWQKMLAETPPGDH